VIWSGTAEPDTGKPGTVLGKTKSRILRAPTDGHVIAHVEIGEHVREGDVIAHVSGAPIVAPFDGVLRGIVHERVQAWQGLKVGDLDPRGNTRACFTISDKSLAVGGGVVEAVLASDVVRLAIRQNHEAVQSV
jgi:xanthine dehydrogenase accessory factor